jgi:hypothetical protein
MFIVIRYIFVCVVSVSMCSQYVIVVKNIRSLAMFVSLTYEKICIS